MTAKEKHREKLLEYLGNPENEFLNRVRLAIEVLGFAKRESLYQTFTLDELNEIEAEALEIRRKKYKSEIAKADKALFKQAHGGDVAAIKLCYQKFEDWSERHRNELTGENGKDLKWTVEIVDPDEK
jgi:hypothetical protein